MVDGRTRLAVTQHVSCRSGSLAIFLFFSLSHLLLLSLLFLCSAFYFSLTLTHVSLSVALRTSSKAERDAALDSICH